MVGIMAGDAYHRKQAESWWLTMGKLGIVVSLGEIWWMVGWEGW